MKKWLKRHGKKLVCGLGILFIANSISILFTTTEEWKIVWTILVIIAWSAILMAMLGVVNKIFQWWEKD